MSVASDPVLEFGVFDHLDQGGRRPSDFFEQRLRLVEKYDRAGFYAFHPAEHHGTPLSLSPSPNIFLAAAAARTSRIRLAPLVYVLPLYRPLRLIEEICTLDHLSKGRIEIGVGRGIAPFELVINGINPLEAWDIFRETLEVLERGLGARTLTYHGRYHNFSNVPLVLEPYQKPHPPFWYGVFKDPESAVMPARKGWNICGITSSTSIGASVARYLEIWREANAEKPRTLPKLGMHRIVVVGDSDARAEELARKAVTSYKDSLNYLWNRFGAKAAQLPESFESMRESDLLVAGNPDSVRTELARQARAAGVNYCAVKFSLGDLTDADTERSIELFVQHVMPAFAPRPEELLRGCRSGGAPRALGEAWPG